jgi:uncharacterized protein
VKLHAAGPSTANTVTGYGDDYVLVNGQRHEANLVLMPDRIVPWEARSFDALTEADFLFLKNLAVEIVLLGTGKRQRFPRPQLTAPLAAARIGLEVMDLKAACRTFNILVAEERKVAVALLFQ